MPDVKIEKKTVDLKKIFYKKNPKLAKWIPEFVFNFLKKLIHEDDANRILYENRDKMGIDFVEAALDDLGANIEVFGLENIPASGKYTLISNHPLGGYDGLALMKTVGRVRKDLYFLANDILMSLPNLKPLFIPVNKHGSNKEYREILNKSFSQDNLMIIMPAGMVSRKINGEIIDLPWKYSFITQSKRNKRDIIPVFIDAENSKRFYRVANWRKKLKIKFNLEMLLLPDELFKFGNKPIKIYIGAPISYKFLLKDYSISNLSYYFRRYVYDLKNNIGLEFNEELISQYSQTRKNETTTDN